MSISYHGVPTRDVDLALALVAGRRDDAPPIDQTAIRDALRELGLEGDDHATLDWEDEDGYVAVDVFSHHVDITHGTRGGDAQLALVMDAIYVLQAHGLHVWDPQQGDWFPSAD